jgi:hypothetical protein
VNRIIYLESKGVTARSWDEDCELLIREWEKAAFLDDANAPIYLACAEQLRRVVTRKKRIVE